MAKNCISIAKLFALGSVVFSATASFAQTTKLSQVEIFNRCYFKIVKNVVPTTDGSLGKALLTQVSQKKMSAADACTVLLEQTEFLDLGQKRARKYTSYPALSDLENKQVIATFHNLHNTFFSQKDLPLNTGANDPNNTILLKDLDEPSLYFTRALFGKSVKVETVFTSNQSLRGVREAPNGASVSRWLAKSVNPDSVSVGVADSNFRLNYGTSGVSATWGVINLADDEIASFGKLVGVEVPKPIIVPSVTATTSPLASATMRNQVNSSVTLARENVNLFEHLGGGILGSQMFMMKNTNIGASHMAGTNNDPDGIIARRVSSRVFENLLCHQMPSLAESDVPASEVHPNSPHGFRLSKSCQQCHYSLDPMAHTFRNLLFYGTRPNSNDVEARKLGNRVMGFTKLREVAGSQAFVVQPPKGALNYRTHDNKLVKKPVNNMNELGSELSKSPDFYRCIVKNYYNYFTGYDVNLTTRNVADDNNEAKYFRYEVYKIAADLQKNQNMTLMIKDILKSAAFSNRQYVPEK